MNHRHDYCDSSEDDDHNKDGNAHALPRYWCQPKAGTLRLKPWLLVHPGNPLSATAQCRQKPGNQDAGIGLCCTRNFPMISCAPGAQCYHDRQRLTATFHQEKTPAGAAAKSRWDSVMHYSRGGFITQARTGKAAPRRPPADNPPGGIYPCKPGGPNDYVYLLTSRANPEHWPRLLKLIGREDLIGDERYE